MQSGASSSASSALAKDDSEIKRPPVFRFLALKGGGARGFIHLGVALALKRMGLLDDIEMVAGSSAGAIAALLLATGWPIEKIIQELNKLDLQAAVYQSYSLSLPYKIFQHFGWQSGDGLIEWFKKIIKEVTGNEDATFLDWHQKKDELDRTHSDTKMKNLYFEACNLNTGFNEEFSHTSKHKDDVPIWQALRASMSYTGFFTPVKIKGCLYGDGGLQSDCPIMMFETIQGTPNPLMLAVWMDSFERLRYIHEGIIPSPIEINSASSAMYSQAVALYNIQLVNLRRSKYRDEMIYCDTLDIDTLDFALCETKIERLIQSGIYGTVRYFMLKYPEFCKQHFDPVLLKHMVEMNYPISIAQFEETPIFIKLHDGESLIISASAADSALEDSCSSRWCYLPHFRSQPYIGHPLSESDKDDAASTSPSGTHTGQPSSDSIQEEDADVNAAASSLAKLDLSDGSSSTSSSDIVETNQGASNRGGCHLL